MSLRLRTAAACMSRTARSSLGAPGLSRRVKGARLRAVLRFPPRASGGPLQAEFRVRGPRTSARKSVWRGSWASRDLGLQEFLEAQMDLEAQMEAQIHF